MEDMRLQILTPGAIFKASVMPLLDVVFVK
jgi:hypothetical protein